MSICEDAAAKHGRVVLFIGNECLHWGPAEFAAAGRFARTIGADTIAPKRFNGNEKWYGSPAQLKDERDAVLATGAGYLPFGYCYGPVFGAEQVQIECATMREIMSVNDGMVCADMEREWNGQAGYAADFARAMAGHGGILTISTWADPHQQNWDQVVRTLAPVVSVWSPMEYTDWLAAQETQLLDLGAACLQPAIDLNASFGPDHQVQIAQDAAARGDQTIWLWDYAPAIANPGLALAITSAFGISPPTPPPPPPPPGGWYSYTVQSGDSLWAIAQHLKLTSYFTDLYQPNMDVIEAAARAHGLPSSEQGRWIYPNTVLRYRR